ncbi:SDR family NAD(P)-dependent oxidoreductase [Streptomyces botrytidirepellens]|uniref:SDR family NAD(P)-dependent oxidoreductase n=1 Tax=Streptomyces botrytidirepellens TaxID=2486417 RepID=A0A3M8WWN2_9ACTN|nr:SDR family NAD(P)-dependent oxidoreductase [Streptomyces botrytidirepellens]RNG34167.1 SDR family NAD(P)-dependent oxidoreductase [Streptomyces botrytidirepellens]
MVPDTPPTGLNRPLALVTGCSSGIGLRTVPALVRRGFHVVATMRDAERRARPGELTGEHVTVLPLDIRSAESVRGCVGTVLDMAGRIDVLVNNAGIAPPNFAEEAPLSQWREVFETNVFGHVSVTNAVLPSMRAAGRGRVVMVSSLSGRVPTPLLGVYCASKFAIEGYAETLRLELRSTGVRVALVEPGAFRTGIWDSPMLAADFPQSSDYARDFARLRAFYTDYIAHHLGNPDRVAKAVARVATGRTSRLRHPVGADAWTQIALRAVLPWAAYERVARALVGLGG